MLFCLAKSTPMNQKIFAVPVNNLLAKAKSLFSSTQIKGIQSVF
jgi:hypothetical protein